MCGIAIDGFVAPANAPTPCGAPPLDDLDNGRAFPRRSIAISRACYSLPGLWPQRRSGDSLTAVGLRRTPRDSPCARGLLPPGPRAAMLSKPLLIHRTQAAPGILELAARGRMSSGPRGDVERAAREMHGEAQLERVRIARPVDEAVPRGIIGQIVGRRD